jgi:hypothetical protein
MVKAGRGPLAKREAEALRPRDGYKSATIAPPNNEFRRKSMLELRANCECCDRDLSPSTREALNLRVRTHVRLHIAS